MDSTKFLREAKVAEKAKAEERKFYESVLLSVAKGTAEESDIEAARFVAGKHGWNFDDDLAVLNEVQAARSTWSEFESFEQAFEMLGQQAGELYEQAEKLQAQVDELENQASRLSYRQNHCSENWAHIRNLKRKNANLENVIDEVQR